MNDLLKLLRRPLRHVFGLSLVMNLLMLVPALFMLQVYDRVLASQSLDTLTVLLVGVGIAFALTGTLDYLRSRLQGVAGTIVGEALSPAVAALTIARGARPGGAVGSEGLRDVQTLRSLFSAQGLLAMFDAPWAVAYVALIALIHPALGWAAAAAALTMLGLALLNDRITRADIESLQAAAGSASRYLERSIHNAEAAQAMGMTPALVARWGTLNDEALRLQKPTAVKSVAMGAITRIFRQAVQVAMLSLGAWLVIQGEATGGVMIATSTLLGRALAPVEQIVGSWRVLAEGRVAYRRLAALMDEQRATPARMTLPEPTGALLAAGLFFRPDGSERTLLNNVSLQLAPGEVLGVLGPSGAGKSTLVRVLIGLWKPGAGTVRLDGVDLSQWPREEVGPWLGYVPQDVELFPGTVAENIARLGAVDSEAVVEAARRARVHELVLSLPEGYETRVDRHALSPGQRQRIALARALYGKPKLVVMDEPNSNLDGAGEAALAETLKALRGETTVIVVTHRTTLVQHVDKLLVMEAGRVSQFGPAADVMKALAGGRPGDPAAGPAGGTPARGAASADGRRLTEIAS